MPKRKKGKHYFTSDTEAAIVAYCATEDSVIRTSLYQEHIQPAFNEMVDKIVYTYKVDFDSMIREIESLTHKDQKGFLDEQEDKEFWFFLYKEVEGWSNVKLKENEKKVLDAVIVLMKDIEKIEIFNKKAIYLYLREITGLNTKQIVSCLNKMRARYRTFKFKWDNGEIH